MMDRRQYLLLKLAEECVEVAHRCSKQMQFGKDEIQPGQSETNAERLRSEFNDLVAVAEMLIQEGELPGISPTMLQAAIWAKRQKINKYLKISQERGLVGV